MPETTIKIVRIPSNKPFKSGGRLMNRMIRLIPILIGITVLSAVVGRAQSPGAASKAPATVAGRVTLDGAGAPGAQVMLKPQTNDGITRTNSGVEQPPALGAATDSEGRYRITDAPPGVYRISVFAPAYAVEGESDPLTPGRTINVPEGDNVEGIDFALTRGAVITGMVTDENDRPVIAAPVNAYKLDANGERQRPGEFNYAFVRWETDDRGAYRIFGLEAGRYLVAAGIESGGGRTSGAYRHTFHPDSVDETRARVVEVKSGAEATNIDIKVAPSGRGYVVKGRVVDAESGEPVPGATVNYNAAGQRAYSTGGVVTNALGEFRLENAPPNSYHAFVVNINTKDGGAATYGDEIKFDVVDRDVSGLEIRTPRGATISGVVAIEGSNDPALRAKLARASLFAQTASRTGFISVGLGGNGTVSPNGTFRLSNLQPGKTRIMMMGVGAPKGFALLRVEHNGAEVKEFNVNAGDQITGVRLVFAYGNGVIAGRVELKGGSLPAGWRMKVSYIREGGSLVVGPIKYVDVDGRGQFVIEGLMQGTYRLHLDVLSSSPDGEYTVKSNAAVQIVTVAGEGRHEVTLVVDLPAKEKDR